jgi:hypothetical protein
MYTYVTKQIKSLPWFLCLQTWSHVVRNWSSKRRDICQTSLLRFHQCAEKLVSSSHGFDGCKASLKLKSQRQNRSRQAAANREREGGHHTSERPGVCPHSTTPHLQRAPGLPPRDWMDGVMDRTLSKQCNNAEPPPPNPTICLLPPPPPPFWTRWLLLLLLLA